MSSVPFLVVALAVGIVWWLGVGIPREKAHEGGPDVRAVVGRVARFFGYDISIARLRLFGLGTGRPELDYRTDVYVVGVLGVTLAATWVLEAVSRTGTSLPAIVAACVGVYLMLGSLGYVYVVVDSGSEIKSAMRSLLLGFVNFIQVGIAFGNVYFALWLANHRWWAVGDSAPYDAPRGVLLSLGEQFGRAGPDPASWQANAAVICHASLAAFVVLVVVNGFADRAGRGSVVGPTAAAVVVAQPMPIAAGVSASDTALVAALRYLDGRVAGVTRLDQQLVYIPLAALSGLFTVAATSHTMLTWVTMDQLSMVGWAIWVGVGIGLSRNELRHRQLRRDRTAVIGELRVPVKEEPGVADWLGRFVYFGLFSLGLYGVLQLMAGFVNRT